MNSNEEVKDIRWFMEYAWENGCKLGRDKHGRYLPGWSGNIYGRPEGAEDWAPRKKRRKAWYPPTANLGPHAITGGPGRPKGSKNRERPLVWRMNAYLTAKTGTSVESRPHSDTDVFNACEGCEAYGCPYIEDSDAEYCPCFRLTSGAPAGFGPG